MGIIFSKNCDDPKIERHFVPCTTERTAKPVKMFEICEINGPETHGKYGQMHRLSQVLP